MWYRCEGGRDISTIGGRFNVNLSVVDTLWFFVGSKCRVQCGTHVITNLILFYLPDLAWLKNSQCKWCTEAFYNGISYRFDFECSLLYRFVTIFILFLYESLFMCSTQTFVLCDWADDVLA